MTPFGPQLIGATEKALNALLTRCLRGTKLTERHWVTLRIAQQAESSLGNGPLASEVRRRAHFAAATELVKELSTWGLIENGSITDRGRGVISLVEREIEHLEGPGRIWADLSGTDIAAAERVLNQVLDRTRLVLASSD